MASRGKYGARLLGHTERDESRDRLPPGSSRTLSATSAASSASRIPAYTSFFSRSKPARAEVEPPKVRSDALSKRTVGGSQIPAATPPSGIGSVAKVQQQQTSQSLGLGIVATNSASATKTPKLEKRPRSVLRRKASAADQHSQYARTEFSMSSYEPEPPGQNHETVSSPGAFRDPFAGAILGMAMPVISSSTSYLPGTGASIPHQATSNSRMASYNPHPTSHVLSTPNLPPPASSFAHSSGSSTRRSESPGAFSRTSTPTSMSSYSPGIPLATKSPLRVRQVSPTSSRPPVTRRRVGNLLPQHDSHLSQNQGLPALRESGTSSSSSSTVKGADRVEGIQSRKAHGLLPSPSIAPPLHLPKTSVKPRDEAPIARRALQPAEVIYRQPERPFRAQTAAESKKSPIQPARSSGPPPRPSREGTPKLDDSTKPSPIIRSNLSRLITTGHKRRESQDQLIASPDARWEAPAIPRPALGRSPSSASTLSVKPSRLPSPNPASVNSMRPRPFEVLLRTRDMPPLDVSVGTGRTKDSSPLSGASSKSSSRFGLFTRRTKSPMETTVLEGSDKTAKKGPAAGTGHEGYGKYAKRGRSGSVSTSASRGRSTSTGGTPNSLARTPTSRKSSITSRGEPEMDDFLLERLAPVVISGGGVFTDIRDSSADSYGNVIEGGTIRKPLDEEHAPRGPLAYAQAELSKPPSASTSTESKVARRGSRLLTGGRDLGRFITTKPNTQPCHEPRRPTLAARRSLHRSQLFREAEPMKIPAPINTQVVAPTPFVNSYDAMHSPALRTDSSPILADNIFEGREGNWLRPKKPEKRSRSPRKWNFFQRTHATTKKATEIRPINDSVSEVPVTISRVLDSRSIAHYAMLDINDPERSSSSTVNLASDVYKPMESPYSGIPSAGRELETDMHKENHKYSMLLPSPPNFFASEFTKARGPPSPIAVFRQPDPVASSTLSPDGPPKPREPRLQQVGRIPRVISKRDRLHKPPPQSFSRPFVRPLAPTTEVLSSATGPSGLETVPRPVLGVQPETLASRPWTDDDSAKPASMPIDARSRFSPPGKEEFLSFAPRKDSVVSASSSSGIFSSTATTAIIPQPDVFPAEDEVWNEYDELLDIVESSAPQGKGSSTSAENNARQGRLVPAPLYITKDRDVLGPTADRLVASPASPRTKASTAEPPNPPRRSNLLSPLQSAELVSTPLSFSDFFAGYGDRNRASAASKGRSISPGSRYSARSAISESDSRNSRDDENRKRNTEIMAEKTDRTPGSQSNLRFSALMTSRWLSFGRVLFSPAHMEIQSNRHGRVLVLDGLGNDDWSFYCALTYPDATVYNLSPFQGAGDMSMRKQEVGGYQSPSNHRQVYYTSISHPFPFPKGFFTAAVFRFPVASSEASCYNAISECKRVLRPGGYLEMSILDLDMVNMGNRARRAVRMLKVRMQVADPEISLKPASDNIQKMLGRRGFENLNRCMVNVPIAGHISDSRAGSFDEKDMSLGDMLKDSSQQGDEGISKMIAKVGRWWYTRCYEMSVLPHDNLERSIWADRALLRECEKRETGLKLLICFAQKPLAPKRRTVSM